MMMTHGTPGARGGALRSRTAAASPNDHYLEEARAAKQARDRAAYEAACEAWLREEKGFAIGDVLRLHYRAETREVLLERFELHWPAGQSVQLPTLVFEGPTLQARPRRVTRISNWCGRESRATKQSRPSAFLRSQLAELAME